jgi:hypothetical protein
MAGCEASFLLCNLAAQAPETVASSLDQIGRNNASSIGNSYSEEMERAQASSANDAAKQELGVLETYRCNADYLRMVKPRFWRVTHAESQAESNSCGDIVASKTAADVQSNQDLKLAVERHLDWRCRIPSSFISVFDDREHAINWAINARNRQEKRREYSPVYVQEINTAHLDDVCVLHLGRIVQELGISSDNVKHEYLILYNIPRHALESNTDVAILEERGERKLHPLTTRYTDLKTHRSKHVYRKPDGKILVTTGLMIYMDTTTRTKSVKNAIQLTI